jgi:hypothetical protein
MKDKFIERLPSLKKGNQLITIKRRIFNDESITGFVINFSNELILLEIIDDDFYQTGYSIIRIKDISLYKIHEENTSFIYLASIKLGVKKSEIDINLASYGIALKSIMEEFPLVTIHEENCNSYVSIGIILKASNKFAHLLELDSDADWADIEKHNLKEITQISFGSGYEKALWAVAREDLSAYTEKRALTESFPFLVNFSSSLNLWELPMLNRVIKD